MAFYLDLFFTPKKKTGTRLANGKGRFRTLGFPKSKPFIFSLYFLPRQNLELGDTAIFFFAIILVLEITYYIELYRQS